MRFNVGDQVCSVNGVHISSIDDVLYALTSMSYMEHSLMDDRRSSLIPVLTYNPYRKIRSALMTVTISNSLVRDGLRIDVGRGHNRHIVKIDDAYDIGEKLGEGAFAVVVKATDRATGRPCAIKIVNRSSLDRKVELALRDEISILSDLRHDHVMALYDSVATIERYYLITEYLEGGELFDRIVDKSSYTESEARDLCGVLFGALDYISSRGIVHRDLKPENLLLASRISDTNIKIADFGFAKFAPNEHSLATMCGTPGYIAPEILRREKYGTKSDMWSVGVIVFILLGGYPPFYSTNTKKLLMLTMAGKFEYDPEYWGGISQSCKDMIRSLLELNPARRASAGDILNHPWMEEDRERLRRIILTKSQMELKKFIARTRLRKAINCVVFVNDVAAISCHNALFTGKNKRRRTKEIEDCFA
ncbi:hypothetical protein ACHAXA_003229 [Cyclostephanos tholiformis]|uniref:Protein kinase domain-containing protein n=1 Tax=Cyclostephanos tholiformis TaxID=382380 RepID=A0ABD3RP30_9STRA